MADELNAKLDQARVIEAELREKLVKAQTELQTIDADQKTLAYGANTGNESARRSLEKLNKRKIEISTDIDNLKTAVTEAEQRVAAAEKEVRVEAEHERARAALALLGEFRSCGKAVDDALDAAVAKYGRLREILFELHRLGFANPTIAQLAALGRRAVMTRFMGTDLQVEHLAPSARRSMNDLIGEYAANIESRAKYRAGVERSLRMREFWDQHDVEQPAT